jgi:hypothetical protein
MIKSLQFLFNSIKSLGIRNGFRYWKIYNACKKDPWLVKRWEQVSRWESAKIESSDPQLSQILEGWANQLKKPKS